MILFKKLSFFLVLLTCLVQGNLNACIETKNARLNQPALGLSGAQLSVSDDKLSQLILPSSTSGFTTLSSKMIVEFGIDQTQKIFHNHAFQSTISFQYETYDIGLNISATQTGQLVIIYDPNVSPNVGIRKDKSFLELTNAYKIDIFNISVSTIDLDNFNTSIPNPVDLYLEAEVQTTRNYSFDACSSVPNISNVGYNEIQNLFHVPYELEVYWDYIPGAEEYEMEWTYVDNYGSTLSVSANLPYSLLPYDFNHDATHIVTSNQFYRIPLVYERGVILFRVRGIGRNPAAPDVRIEGPWSTSQLPCSTVPNSLESGTVDMFVAAFSSVTIPPYYEIASPFHEGINWGSEKTFAEKGRKGSGVQFKDGTLHTRQSIARLNTEDNVVVQTTLYDFQGRPVITTLPSPLPVQDFFYKANMDMYSAGVQYDKNIFQNTANSTCNGNATPMDPVNSVGAANYYSPNNPNKDAQQGHIADAQGFPFIQIEYYPDPQSRVRRQTIPGPTHQLNTGHEVTFFYVSPTPDELTRMFGSEVGLADGYEKHLAVDPNGQVSVTYVDDEERVIATSLSGNSPGNLDEIEESSSAVPQTLSQNLIVNNLPDANNLSYSSTTSFYADLGALTQTIDYSMTSPSYSDPCMPNFCFECLYELNIKITDDCGNEVIDFDGTTPGIQALQVYVGDPNNFTTSCPGAPVTFNLPTSPMTISLPSAGQYYITKTLQVSTLPVATYAQLYVQNNTCGTSLSTFQQQALNSIDFSGCTGGTCQECTTAVNNYATLHASDPNPLSANQIATLLANCNNSCNAADYCSSHKQAIVQQFSPSGQYATYQTDITTGNYISTDAYSIYNPINSLNTLGPHPVDFSVLYPGTGGGNSPSPSTSHYYFWNNPPLPYKDATGTRVQVLNTAGLLVYPEQLSINEFISGFQSSWANSWLPMHPEYCKMQFNCLPDVSAATSYLLNIESANSLDDACISGIAVPIGGSIPGAPICNCSAPHYNPLLTSTDPNLTPYLGSPYHDLTNFTLSSQGTSYTGSIYQVVMAILRGVSVSALGSATLGDDPCTRDMEWSFYKALLMGYQNNLLITAENNFIGSSYPGSGNAAPGQCGTVPPGFIQIFLDANSGSGQPGYVDLNALANTISSGSPGSGTSSPVPPTASCAQTCAGYALSWLQSLAPCGLTSSSPNWDIAGSPNDIQGNLITICSDGCDGTSPFGASSVNYNTYPSGVVLTDPSGINYTANSFQDVLDHYGYTSTATCSSYLINMPATYGHSYSTASSTNPVLDKCGCDKILHNHLSYLSQPGLACTISESAYFEQQYGLSVDNYATAFCACSTAVSADPGNIPLTSSYVWSYNEDAALYNYMQAPNNPIYIASGLACDQCIVCGELKKFGPAIQATFNVGAPLATTINTIDHAALANYLNGALDMNNTYGEWITFINDCQNFAGTTPEVYSSNLSPQAADLPAFLTNLAQLNISSGLLTVSNMPSYFNSSLYPQSYLVNTVGQSVNYSAGIVGNQITLSLLNTSILAPTNCTIDLLCETSLPNPFPTNQGHFYNLKAECTSNRNPGGNQPVGSTGTVADYYFQISYDYVDNLGTHTLVFDGSSCYPITNPESLNLAMSQQKCGPMLCSKGTFPPAPATNDCINTLINNALNTAQTNYNNNIAPYINQFIANYKGHCFANVSETFIRKYDSKEYHFTLYYYDQAGNLVHTVAPKGVQLLSTTDIAAAELNIANPTLYPRIYPAHSLNSTLPPSTAYFCEPRTSGVGSYVNDFGFNSFNLPIQQTTPDGGHTVYFYDQVGRPVASQNALQASQLKYSYTLYDALGRITDVGVVKAANFFSLLTNAIAADPVQWASFINGNIRSEITHTQYDYSLNSTINTVFGVNGQENLRNRVSSSTYEVINDNNPNTFDYGTHYSYDDHGNVFHLVQDNPSISIMGGAFAEYKHIYYEYDIESGATNMIKYQPGQIDQLYHKYIYDADNRLHEVYTSMDGFTWDQDGKYFYYKHGPHARTEIGEDKVQGIDYAYTIQGWIKGINSNLLTNINDLGQDGATGSAYMSSFASIHQGIAKDAASFNLNYFANDYSAIKSSANNFVANKSALYGTGGVGLDLTNDAPDLYNGNISSMVTSIFNLNPTDPNNYKAVMPQLTAYRYDQLQRIKHMKAYSSYYHNSTNPNVLAIDNSTNQWNTPTITNYKGMYECAFDYDRNGNLSLLNRKGNYDGTSLLQMDLLTYNYTNATNQLKQVQDNLGSDAAYAGNFTNDIDDQTDANNYTYDAIGQLQHNTQEEIDVITWNSKHKVAKITRLSTSTKPDLEFLYDAQGHRVAKIVKPRNGTGLVPSSRWATTYYVRDFHGNILSTYQKYAGPVDLPVLSLQDQEIYGTGREGTIARNIQLYPVLPPTSPPNVVDHLKDQKQYEISNHLGNVLTTVSDRKIQEDGTGVDIGGNGVVDYYTANVISATDYYPYGQTIPGRSFNNPNYRFGHNGQEKDNEIFEGALGAEYWEYDARIGMRWDIDPKSKPDISPYACFAGNPIALSDPDGDDPILGLIKAGLKVATELVKEMIDAAKKGEKFHPDWTAISIAATKGFLEGMFEPLGDLGELVLDIVGDFISHINFNIHSYGKPRYHYHHRSYFKSGQQAYPWADFLADVIDDIVNTFLPIHPSDLIPALPKFKKDLHGLKSEDLDGEIHDIVDDQFKGRGKEKLTKALEKAGKKISDAIKNTKNWIHKKFEPMHNKHVQRQQKRRLRRETRREKRHTHKKGRRPRGAHGQGGTKPGFFKRLFRK